MSSEQAIGPDAPAGCSAAHIHIHIHERAREVRAWLRGARPLALSHSRVRARAHLGAGGLRLVQLLLQQPPLQLAQLPPVLHLLHHRAPPRLRRARVLHGLPQVLEPLLLRAPLRALHLARAHL